LLVSDTKTNINGKPNTIGLGAPRRPNVIGKPNTIGLGAPRRPCVYRRLCQKYCHRKTEYNVRVRLSVSQMYAEKPNTMCWCEDAWSGFSAMGRGIREVAIRVDWTAEVLTLSTRRVILYCPGNEEHKCTSPAAARSRGRRRGQKILNTRTEEGDAIAA
jgi:hypothetical protein